MTLWQCPHSPRSTERRDKTLELPPPFSPRKREHPGLSLAANSARSSGRGCAKSTHSGGDVVEIESLCAESIQATSRIKVDRGEEALSAALSSSSWPLVNISIATMRIPSPSSGPPEPTTSWKESPALGQLCLNDYEGL